jgi:hypothetical protein
MIVIRWLASFGFLIILTCSFLFVITTFFLPLKRQGAYGAVTLMSAPRENQHSAAIQLGREASALMRASDRQEK